MKAADSKSQKDPKKRNMLKARLRRLCELKKNGKLGVPQWVHDLWRSGDKDDLADQLEKSGFDKDH